MNRYLTLAWIGEMKNSPASMYIFIVFFWIRSPRRSFLIPYLPSKYNAVPAVAATAAAATMHEKQVSFVKQQCPTLGLQSKCGVALFAGTYPGPYRGCAVPKTQQNQRSEIESTRLSRSEGSQVQEKGRKTKVKEGRDGVEMSNT